MPHTPGALTLSALNRQIAMALSQPAMQNVWVVAETSDLRVNRGHCYLELIEKNPDTGTVEARLRAVVWASVFVRIDAEFRAATGQSLQSGLKVMVCGSVNYHSAYGISFVISAVDPSYTIGEAERRRREIIRRLSQEGMLELNRMLPWPVPAQRIAVISAPGAAGYGDFLHQLFGNPSRLRFHVRLFTALMQGERTVPSVIAALEQIAADIDSWDCVVIIRGGGATSELQAFDNYDLAANIAQFPLPVIVGIGHERDVTVLDYVANLRVKTPTAAAEWLISNAQQSLDRLRRLAADILSASTGCIAASAERLAYLQSAIDIAPAMALDKAGARLRQSTALLAAAVANRMAPEPTKLNATMQAIASAAANAVSRAADRLRGRRELLDALSPQATLKRGYSITLKNGRAIKSASQLQPGDCLTTLFADGSVESNVNTTSHGK